MQLGERLATVQLLRDGLYRACEAFANGAISDATYAMIVSKIDDTMVTMLASEVAGGAFGRPLMSTGAASSANHVVDSEKLSDENETLTRLRKEKYDLENSATKANPKTSEIAKKEIEIDQQRRLINQLLTGSTASKSVTGDSHMGGYAQPHAHPTNANNVAQIHNAYIKNHSIEPLIVACVSALQNDRRGRNGESNPLVKMCTDMLTIENGTNMAASVHTQALSSEAETERRKLCSAMLYSHNVSCTGDSPGTDKDGIAYCKSLKQRISTASCE